MSEMQDGIPILKSQAFTPSPAATQSRAPASVVGKDEGEVLRELLLVLVLVATESALNDLGLALLQLRHKRESDTAYECIRAGHSRLTAIILSSIECLMRNRVT